MLVVWRHGWRQTGCAFVSPRVKPEVTRRHLIQVKAIRNGACRRHLLKRILAEGHNIIVIHKQDSIDNKIIFFLFFDSGLYQKQDGNPTICTHNTN